MAIVPAVAVELAVAGEILRLLVPFPEPREIGNRTVRLFAPVLFPFHVQLGPQQARALFARLKSTARNGRMFSRTPSFMSGFHPMA